MKQIRRRAGLTQQEMSDLLEIPKRTIENWEANKSKPTDYLVKLIEYYLENHAKGLSK